MSTTAEFGRGKTIFVLAIVIGCFAVLWPKIFYPMLTASISQTNGDDGHVRQERPFRPGPELIHPALRERGRAIPTVNIPRRTIEREARPGPVPGMRPPVGGAGHIPTGPKGGGTMGIIMPMYTIGIVCFFLYTIMKILFKKSPEAEQAKAAPQVKDYGLDPEHRKYIHSEEYTEGSERSLREPYNKEDREMGLRRRPSAGKSSRFYEDRRKLESPPIIYPTYPSDLETKNPPETTTSTLTSSLETDTPSAKESMENESPSAPPPPTTTTTPPPTPTNTNNVISVFDDEDEQKTDICVSARSPLESKTEQKYNEFQEQSSTSVPSPPADDAPNVPISHDEPETNVTIMHDDHDDSKTAISLVEDSTAQTTEKEPEVPSLYSAKDDETDKSELLSRGASLASSADTIIAETVTPPVSEIEPPVATPSIDNIDSGTSPTSTTTSSSSTVKKQSSVVSPSEMGPFSPLAPDQTPNPDFEEFHFFDRTIVIPDYEPVDPAKAQEQRKASMEAAPPPPEVEVEETPDITIIKQENVPQDVLDMAGQVAEEILDAAKLETVIAAAAAAAEEEKQHIPVLAAPTPSPAGETLTMIPLTDDDTTASFNTTTPFEPASEYPSLSQQPRLSLDTNIAVASLESATNAAIVHDPTKTPPVTDESVDTTARPCEPSAPPPQIQVETPHADQTELNIIAEYLETLNTEPKETEKLAANAASSSEIQQNSPIVTLAEEAKEFSETDTTAIKSSPDDQVTEQSVAQSSSSGGAGVSCKSKIEITPFEDIQPPSPMLEKLGLGELPDICYVTQPLDESQKGRNKAQFLKSRVEIVSIDESLPMSEPIIPLPVEKDSIKKKERKTSVPVQPSAGLLLGEERSSSVTESLEEAVKKLRRVPQEPAIPEQKDKKALRKGSTASEHSQLDSPKPSEIDKYVDKIANMQESRKAMIEREMFKSLSQSSQSSGAAGQQADQSSNFHGPGLLDSGQIESHLHSLPPEEFPSTSVDEVEEDFLDKMKEVDKWATATTGVPRSQASYDDETDMNIDSLVKVTGCGHLVPVSSAIIIENDDDNYSNAKLISEQSLDREGPGTVAIDFPPLSEEAIQMVTSIIDQALRDGINEVVNTIMPEQARNSMIDSHIEKLDQVLDEIDYRDGGGKIRVLSSISKRELNNENLEDELLKSLGEEQVNVCKLTTGVGAITKSNLDDDNKLTDSVKHLTQADIRFAKTQTDPQFQTETPTTTNTCISADTTAQAIITTDTDNNTRLQTSTDIADESNLAVRNITEECEISSAATASAEASTTITPAPTTVVESCLPSEPITLPNTTPSSEPVVESHEQDKQNLEESQRHGDKVKTEPETETTTTKDVEKVEQVDQDQFIAELDTIQEEIENLSTELNKMENAGAVEAVQHEEKASFVETPPQIDSQVAPIVPVEEKADEEKAIVAEPSVESIIELSSSSREQLNISSKVEEPLTRESSQITTEADISTEAKHTEILPTEEEIKEKQGGQPLSPAEPTDIKSGDTMQAESIPQQSDTRQEVITENVLDQEAATDKPIDVQQTTVEVLPELQPRETQEDAAVIPTAENTTPPTTPQAENLDEKIQTPTEVETIAVNEKTVEKQVQQQTKTEELDQKLEAEEKTQASVVENKVITEPSTEEAVVPESTPKDVTLQPALQEEVQQSINEEVNQTEAIVSPAISEKVAPLPVVEEIEAEPKVEEVSQQPTATEEGTPSSIPQDVAPQEKTNDAVPQTNTLTESTAESAAAEIAVKLATEDISKSVEAPQPLTEEEASKSVSAETALPPFVDDTVSKPVADEDVSKSIVEVTSQFSDEDATPKPVTEGTLESISQELESQSKPTAEEKTLEAVAPKEDTPQPPVADTTSSEPPAEDASESNSQKVAPQPSTQVSKSQEDVTPQISGEEEILKHVVAEVIPKPADEGIVVSQSTAEETTTPKPAVSEPIYEEATPIHEICAAGESTTTAAIEKVEPAPETLVKEATFQALNEESVDKTVVDVAHGEEKLSTPEIDGTVATGQESQEEVPSPTDETVLTLTEEKAIVAPSSEQVSATVSSELEKVCVPEPVIITDNLPLSPSAAEVLPQVSVKSEEPLLQASDIPELESIKVSPEPQLDQVVSSELIKPDLSSVASSSQDVTLAPPEATVIPKQDEPVTEISPITTDVPSSTTEEIKSEPITVLSTTVEQLIPSDVQSLPPQEATSVSEPPTQSTTTEISAQQPEIQAEQLHEEQIPKSTESEQVASTPTAEETKPTVEETVAEQVQTPETSCAVAAAAVPLRFETLSEPPFPLPDSSTSTITPLSQSEQNTLRDTDSENNKIIDSSSSSPDTITVVSSCGLLVDSSNLIDQPQPSGTSMALTVELLDENSPEIFPLPSTNITTISSKSTPPTSPVEKAQLDQSEKENLVSPIVNAGVSLSAATTTDTDQASSASITTTTTTPTTCIEVTAEKQATQALSPINTTIAEQDAKESIQSDLILSSPSGIIITEEGSTSNVPDSPAPPPPTPAVASSNAPSFPISSKQEVAPPPQPQPPQKVEQNDDDDEAKKESGHRERDARDLEIDMLRKRLEETEAAMERIVSQMGSVTDQLSPSVLAQVLRARGEDLEKLIASAEKTSSTKKEDLGTAEEAVPITPTEVQPLKPATRDKREKSCEKEVKFKLPPEELEVEDEEEEIEEEEEVEIVRPPTPPKTLSKAKTKSPPPTTPEPSGSTTHAPLTSSSSHRNHDELLISSMQTTVTGSAADNISTDNHSKSPSPAALIADYYNNTTRKAITPPPTDSNTPTFLQHAPSPQSLAVNNDSKERTISETVTIIAENQNDNDKQSAAAAIAQAKAGISSPSPTPGVSVIGIEETASLISGERWDINRTPTPTFRQPTPPVPHRPPTPPDQIPSIYLEGPMSSRAQEIVVREAQVEVEGGDDYDYDEDYEPSGPVILSGKVTLSVISSVAGALSQDEITEAPSLSLDDRAQAEHSRRKSPTPTGGASSKRSVAAEIASAMNEQVRGKSDGKKSSNASSPDMEEYEVIGKGGFEHDDDDAADVSLEDFLTATDAEQDEEKAQEDTAADISTMDDLKQEPLPKDEE